MGATHILVFVQGFCKVLNTVTAPGGIDIPREAEVGTDTRHEFHTHPIAIGHISSQRFTNFIQFARQHQLILVIHIIKVGTEVQPTIGIGIAQFIVYEAFGFGVVEQLSIGVIVAGRLLVGYTERAEQPTIPIDLPRKSHFRIEEIETFVYVQLLQAFVRQTVPFVVGTLYPIVDVAILHIGIYIQLISQSVIGFQIDVSIRFSTFVAVIFMVGAYLSLIVFHPKHPTEMMPVVVIEPTTQRCIQPVVAIVHGEDSPAKPVVHGFLSHQIAFLHPLIAPLERLQGIFHQLSVGLVLLIIAIAFGIM